MKRLIIIMLVTLSINGYALRCGTTLIEIGDPVEKVEQNCNVSNIYIVKNGIVDVERMIVPEGGGKNTIKVIDGLVYSIEFNRG